MLFFSLVEVSHFSSIIFNKVNGHWILCWRNSSYSFIPFFSKLHWCFGYGLKIFMWLRYNHQIILFLFLQVELSHISSIVYNKVNGQGILCGCNFSYSFSDSFETLLLFWSWSNLHVAWMYSSDFYVTFFASWTIFWALFITMWMDRGYLVGATLQQFYTDFFETSLVFWSWSENKHVIWI